MSPSSRSPTRCRRGCCSLISVLLNLLVVWILLVLLNESFAFWRRGLDMMAATLDLKMAWFYAIVPVSFAAMVLVGIELLIRLRAAPAWRAVRHRDGRRDARRRRELRRRVDRVLLVLRDAAGARHAGRVRAADRARASASCWTTSGSIFAALLSRFYNGVDSFPLLAVPFFILAGELMNSGGITRAIVNFSLSLVGHVRGGLAQVNILSSMLFAGISGSAVADASAIGKMLVPAMDQNGYRRSFAAGVTAAAAVIGPIIPPSGIMVLYGFVMNVSIGALFAAGIVPGIMIGLGLMLVTRLLATRHDLPVAARRATWRERGKAFREAALALVMPVILLGGMLSGFFTATEAAAVAAAYALIVAPFVLRTVGWADMQADLRRDGDAVRRDPDAGRRRRHVRVARDGVGHGAGHRERDARHHRQRVPAAVPAEPAAVRWSACSSMRAPRS